MLSFDATRSIQPFPCGWWWWWCEPQQSQPTSHPRWLGWHIFSWLAAFASLKCYIVLCPRRRRFGRQPPRISVPVPAMCHVLLPLSIYKYVYVCILISNRPDTHSARLTCYWQNILHGGSARGCSLNENKILLLSS